MLRARIQKDMPQHVPKVREGMSNGHLEDIRSCPCARCYAPGPGDPHHLMRVEAGARGMGLHSADRWAIPLCRRCHEIIQPYEEQELAKCGLDGRALAQSLWTLRSIADVKERRKHMERVVFGAYQRSLLR